MMKKLVFLMLATISLIACKDQNSGEKQNIDAENYEQSEDTSLDRADKDDLEYKGTYSGNIDGKQTELTLNENNSYSLRQTDSNGEENPSSSPVGSHTFNHSGEFVWDEDDENVVTLTGLPGGPIQFSVGENHLVQVTKEGQEISEDSLRFYRLNKNE